MPRIHISRPHSIFSFLLCGVGILLFFFFHFTHFFTFQHILCNVNGEACPTFIQVELEELHGTSLFRSAYREKIAKIHEVLPSFSLGKTQRVFPQTLKVQFERVPEEYLLVHPDTAWRVVDGAGIVTQIHTASESGALQSSLPQVHAPLSFVEAIQVNNQVADHVHQAILEILHSRTRHNLSFTVIEVRSSEEIVVTLSDGKVALLPTAETAVALEKLAQVLKTVDFTRFTESITVIDVRFKYPVLKNR